MEAYRETYICYAFFVFSFGIFPQDNSILCEPCENGVLEVLSYDLENVLPKILFNVFMYDAYFGFKCDTSDGKVIFSFEPEDCVITGYVNGMPTFGVRRISTKTQQARVYPDEVVEIFESADKRSDFKGGYVEMPFEKTICIKYNDGFDYIYPPFAFIIKEILDIEDFKDKSGK